MAEIKCKGIMENLKQPHGLLNDIRVLEVGRYIAAPYAGRLLAENGAEVIKIEDPDSGDPMRRWESGDRPYSPQFAAYNYRKQGVALNLKGRDDKARFLSLVEESDVILENFRPGVMDRLGLGYESLSSINPRLVYCSITGFGAEGPYAKRPSYDTVISAMSGLYSLLMPITDPAPIGPALSDLLSGMFATQGIMAALVERARTGRGRRVEVSMLGSVLAFLGEGVTSAVETGRQIEPNTRQRRAQAYGAVGSDGKPFVVHLSVPDKFWRALCDAMEAPEWVDDARFATRQKRYTNYAALDSLIKQRALARAREEWFERFAARDLPHAALNTLGEVVEDAQVAAMGLIQQVPMGEAPPMAMTAPPVRFDGITPPPGSPAPELGADNAIVDALAACDLDALAARDEGRSDG